jgi:hypothetical protein
MAIVGERVGKALAPHGLHRNTIRQAEVPIKGTRQAVFLIRPCAIEPFAFLPHPVFRWKCRKTSVYNSSNNTQERAPVERIEVAAKIQAYPERRRDVTCQIKAPRVCRREEGQGALDLVTRFHCHFRLSGR